MLLLSLFFALLFPPLVVRWLRWLGILQQKEYRLDRVKAFLRSDEGQLELKKVIPSRNEFTRTGMKRPKLTARALNVTALSAVVILVQIAAIFVGIWAAFPQLIYVILYGGVFLVVCYLLVPFSVMVAVLPSSIASAFVVYQTMKKAQQMMLGTEKEPQKKPTIIGIGGSYGKSSTKHLLHHFLSQMTTVFVTPKSFNTKYSIAKSIIDEYHDQEIALLEYGAYITGEIEYMTKWFPPDLAVETGFTPQHLSLFGSRENSLRAEAELIGALPKKGVVFCNGSDEGAVEICRRGSAVSRARTEFYAGPDSSITLKNIGLNKYGQVRVDWKGQTLQTRLVGKQYVVNLQAAIAVSRYFEMSDKKIMEAIESFVPSDSFVQGKILKSGAYLIDDGGTSNPKGFSAALDLIQELRYPRKIVLTAGMIDLGSESDQIHLEMAERAKAMKLEVIHLGVDGQEQFKSVFGESLISDVDGALRVLKYSNDDALILLEGKVTRIVEDEIERMTEKIV